MVTLSGGAHGGESVEWVADGTDEAGRETMQMDDGAIYAKVSDEQAVFIGGVVYSRP